MPVSVRAGGIVPTRADDVTNDEQNPLTKVTRVDRVGFPVVLVERVTDSDHVSRIRAHRDDRCCSRRVLWRGLTPDLDGSLLRRSRATLGIAYRPR
jgi:hypothetical protein